MAAGAYPIPLYRSAVDGLVMPTANDHRRLQNSRPLPALRHPLVLPPFRTPYVLPIAPLHAHILRSSSGFNVVRLPNASRALRTSFLPPTSPRWNSPINMMDLKSLSVGNEKIFMSRMSLTRSESLQVPSAHLVNHAAMPRGGELDARHFCGLAPIPENKSFARGTSDIRPFTFANRR